MKILHTISSIDISTGGPARSATHLIESMLGQRKKVKVELNTLQSANPIIVQFESGNGEINFHKIGFLNYSESLKQQLMKTNPDLFHGHGLWQLPVHTMAKIARRRNIPYIISPRGMLEPWALNAGKWKKKLALALFQRKDLADAACIHATAKMEADNIRKLGFKNPIAIIPNGIDLAEFPMPVTQKQKKKHTLLFLSRVHPKKGIELLIEAWQNLDKTLRQNWQIEIAGNGEEHYIASLQKLIDSKSLQGEIKIIGPQFGEAKLAAYHRANLFVLPTYSENFGIVVAEALACGLPIITTKGTPWEKLNTRNAGWWIDIGATPLAETLAKAMNLSETQRLQMGQNGRQLVEEHYSIEAVAAQMIVLYEWVLGKGEKPGFVYL